MFDLEGKRALVTGASSGLGAHFAKVLASAGAKVTLAARRVDTLAQSGAEIVALDVCDVASIDAAIVAAGPIDILVNNAGIVRSAPVLEQSEADWDAVLDTNLKGMFLVAQGVARSMRAQGMGGSIR